MRFATLFCRPRRARLVNHPVCPHLPYLPSPFLPAACGFAAALAIFALLSILGPASARGAVLGTTNTLDNVEYTTPMWSLADPFAFQTTSNCYAAVTNYGPRIAALEVATDPEAVAAAIAAKMNITGGASTNQSLYGAVFLNAASFTNASGGAAGALSYDPATGAFAGGPAGASAAPFSYGTHAHTNLIGSSTNWLDGNGVKWYTVPAASPAAGPPVPSAYADALVISSTVGADYNGPSSGTVFRLSLDAGTTFIWTSGVWSATLNVSAPDPQDTAQWYWALYNGEATDKMWVAAEVPLPTTLSPQEGNSATTGTVGLAVLGLATNALPLLTRAETEDWTVAPHEAWLTNEQDIAAQKLYYYGDKDIVLSPESDFLFDGVNTVTGYVGSAENVVIPYSIGGVSVTVIGASAFMGSSVVSVVIPYDVTSIEGSAFTFCDYLSSVTIPDSVSVIGQSAFSLTAIGTITLPASLTSIGDGALAFIPIQSIVIPARITSIGNGAFDSCVNLTSVSFAGNAPTVGANLYVDSPKVTNYVLSATAAGFGATLGDRPVVFPTLVGNGSNITGITAEQVGALATNAVRTAGCTDLGSATNLIVTGNTGAFLAYPSADYGVSVAAGSIFDGFSLTINSTNIPTYASNIYTQNSWTATARNILSFVPYTNGLWNVYGRGL